MTLTETKEFFQRITALAHQQGGIVSAAQAHEIYGSTRLPKEASAILKNFEVPNSVAQATYDALQRSSNREQLTAIKATADLSMVVETYKYADYWSELVAAGLTPKSQLDPGQEVAISGLSAADIYWDELEPYVRGSLAKPWKSPDRTIVTTNTNSEDLDILVKPFELQFDNNLGSTTIWSLDERPIHHVNNDGHSVSAGLPVTNPVETARTLLLDDITHWRQMFPGQKYIRTDQGDDAEPLTGYFGTSAVFTAMVARQYRHRDINGTPFVDALDNALKPLADSFGYTSGAQLRILLQSISDSVVRESRETLQLGLEINPAPKAG